MVKLLSGRLVIYCTWTRICVSLRDERTTEREPGPKVVSDTVMPPLFASSSIATVTRTPPSQTTLTTFRTRPLFLSTTESKPPSLKRLPESAEELTLHIPSTATGAAYDKTLAEVSENVSIPGFRKGAKIPPAVIENAWAK